MKYFHIKEFTKETFISPRVADLIVKHHIEPMIPIRERYGGQIIVSQRSGYRSPETEFSYKRPGNSEHCFKGLGASDYTAADLKRLGKLLLDTPYKRICYYPNSKFYHCDYKGKERQLFLCKSGHDWVLVDEW